MDLKIDLHAHSTASDGDLSPQQLVEHALELGLTHLALTDHDSVSGVALARQAAAGRLTLIAGAELSTLWNTKQIHIVGLGLNCDCPSLTQYLVRQKQIRDERAIEIGRRLEKQGFADAYAKTCAQAAVGASITRGNYARFIVSQGRAQNTDDAFNVYLKKGKPCYVAAKWFGIETAVEVILQAQGIPVLAHPLRYDLTNNKLRILIAEFKQAGGLAIEVSSCLQSPNQRDFLARLSREFDLAASCGSDLHHLGPWRDLGLNLQLPEGVKPVWDLAPHIFNMEA